MNRRNFIKKSCTACVGSFAMSALLPACATIKYVPGTIEPNGISIDEKEFATKQKGKFHSYIIVRNETLLFPICLYRINERNYSALWMQCSHQGAELSVSGDFLQCPAHGSEYNNLGKVTSGPADKDIRSFPVLVTDRKIFIDLRKV